MQRLGLLRQKAGRMFHPHLPSYFHKRKDQLEHHWLADHPKLIALLLGALVSLSILGLLSIIHVHLYGGIWPLFG